MRKIFGVTKTLLIVVCVTCLLALAGCGQDNKDTPKNKSYTFKDARGYVTTFDKVPKRILTLSMSLDNIVLGLLPPDRLVGINHLADDPVSSNIVEYGKAIKEKIRNPNPEKILSLKPDVILVNEWTRANVVDSLRGLGFKVVVIDNPMSIELVKKNIISVSAVLQEEEKGKQLITLMDNKMAEIKKKTDLIPESKRKKVVLISLMTSYGGKGCLYDEMCSRAGVINGISAVGLKHGQHLTKELLVKTNADLLLMPVYNDHGNYDTKPFVKEYLEDPSLQTLPAIKNKQLYYPREGYTYNASQDCVFGIQEIALAAYGKEFAQESQNHLQVWSKNE